MNKLRARQVAKVIIPGLAAGGCIGWGVGVGLYATWVGIAGSVMVGVLVFIRMLRLRAQWRLEEDTR